MAQDSNLSLGLVIRGRPYGRRTPRSDVDLALAAAALDFSLSLYFLGEAVLQLVAHRAPQESLLPAGYRAWGSLPELAETRVYAEAGWVETCAQNGLEPVLPVTPMTPEQMAESWRRCRQVLVL